MVKIVGIGEIVLDIIIKDGKPLAAVPGGSVFNAMVSLGRTLEDAEAVMVSQTGDDKVSDIVSSFMSANNIATGYIQKVPCRQSTVSLAVLDNENNASYEFFRDASMPDPSPLIPTFSSADKLLFGSFFAVDAHTRPFVQSVLSRAQKHGATIYYDINFRKSHAPNLEAVFENCSQSDIVRGSAEDLLNLFGTDDVGYLLEKYPQIGPVFIKTAGKDPTEMFCGDQHLIIHSPSIEPVSTIGAGDNFNAGFLYALNRLGTKRTDLLSMSPDALTYAVNTAHSFAAKVCLSTQNYVPSDFVLPTF